MDYDKRLGDFSNTNIGYQTNFNKEEICRKYILSRNGNNKQNFLDVGGNDGLLGYMLGVESNLKYNDALYSKSKTTFDSIYTYYGVDLAESNAKNILIGDICDDAYLDSRNEFINFFDVIYSNNVFEHLEKPWIAAENISRMLKTGGLAVMVVPFSQRYHEVPGDYFRYTHKGLASLFLNSASYKIIECGYDILGRRNNWQGAGNNNDIVPLDKYGAWRETWFTVLIIEKV